VTAAYIAVDPNDALPPYQQIIEQLKALIERGELRPAQILPTVRQLAGDLNVAPNTVARAYADLQDSGWLLSDGRRGTRVSDRAPTANRRVRATTLRKTAEGFIGGLLNRGYSITEIREALGSALRA